MKTPHHARYARCIAASRRVRWDIEADVIRGRDFDWRRPFLPDSLSLVRQLPFLDETSRVVLSQVQGRTYANMFGLVERFIAAKILDLSRDHATGDQVALEALVRFTDEELKHQALFRRLESMASHGMADGYRFVPEANAVARLVLGKSSWAVLALTCDIELFTQAHYRASIQAEGGLCPLWKDVFLFHWQEESQHAILDELEWQRVDATLDDAARDQGVTDLLELVTALDSLLQAQAAADATWFAAVAGQVFSAGQARAIGATLLAAYRWQYIHSGLEAPRFRQLISAMLGPARLAPIEAALAGLGTAPAQAA